MTILNPPRWLAALVALVAGAMAALGFEPWGLWPLTIVGAGLLVALVDTAPTRRRAMLLGWLFGVGHFALGLAWIATAFTFQAKMDPRLGWVAVIGLAMFLAFYTGAAALLARTLARTPPARLLMLAAAFMLCEWLRGWVLSGFAWNPLGAAWLGSPEATGLAGAIWLAAPGPAQLAAFIGALGLSGLMMLAGGSLWLIARPDASPRLRLAGGGLALAIVVAGIIGNARPHETYYPDNPGLFLIQPDIGQDVKYAAGAEEAHLGAYLELTATALATARGGDPVAAAVAAPAPGVVLPGVAMAAPKSNDVAATPAPKLTDGVDTADVGRPFARAGAAAEGQGAIIIWSESSVPYLVEEEPQVRARLAAVLGPRDLLLFGGVAAIRDDNGRLTALTNSLFVLDAAGRLLGRYDKAHLVPLGEYVPARSVMTQLGLARLAPGDIDFRPGPGPRTLALPGFVPAGVQICYEIIFPGAVVDRQARPGWLVNISNDAWFGPTGPPQHLAQARLRAIEEGLPIARATPTGISAIIDAYGRLSAVIPAGVRGTSTGQLPPALPATLFARIGHLAPGLLGLLLLVAGLAIERLRPARGI